MLSTDSENSISTEEKLDTLLHDIHQASEDMQLLANQNKWSELDIKSSEREGKIQALSRLEVPEKISDKTVIEIKSILFKIQSMDNKLIDQVSNSKDKIKSEILNNKKNNADAKKYQA